ncbi:MAG: PfkB family carbohydrate kinase [Promethearchaeota archaeon]
MEKRILVHGSIALDYIMGFDGNLYNNVHISHEKKKFEMAVMPTTKRMQFGGTAGNIAYNLGLLDAPAEILGSVGIDFIKSGYEKHLSQFKNLKLNLEKYENDFCANCYIVNDEKAQQLIVYHGGVTNKLPEKTLKQRLKNPESITYAINSPENPKLMYKLSKELKEMGITTIMDTGQVTPAFSKELLIEMINNSDYLICNEHEYKMICKKIGSDKEYILKNLNAIIRTEGEKGASIFKEDETIKIPIIKPKKIMDPTGAGDGFRAGVLFALHHGCSLEKACKIGATVACFVVETIGAQTHRFSKEEFIERYETSFGSFTLP